MGGESHSDASVQISIRGSDRKKKKLLRDTSDYCGLTNLLLPKKEEKKKKIEAATGERGTGEL